MTQKIFCGIISLLLIGCGGRPLAPINNYGSPSSNRQTDGISSKRPSLPGTGTNKTTNPEKTIGLGLVMSGQDVFKKCNTAVFMVFTSTGFESFQGSGFFVSPNGLALSNYHVFEGTGMGLEVIKTTNDREYKIDRVIFKDKENDVMLFSVKAPNGVKFNYIPISSRPLQIGDKVYAIGSPRGLENTFSSGEISQLRRNGSLIQTSAPFDHGSSGGALINVYGEAIGITCGGYDDSGANLNFAVNIKELFSHGLPQE